MAEWEKVDLQSPETVSSLPALHSESADDISVERERPTAVAVVGAYQWLKAALFAQLFWNLWSPSHASAISALNLSAGSGHNHTVFLLLGVALYLVVLGWGLWSLQKWALLLLLLTWLPDLACDFSPEFFGLEHTADLWLGNQAVLVLLGITIVDSIAFFALMNRKTYRAFNAEDEAKILWIFSGRNEP